VRLAHAALRFIAPALRVVCDWFAAGLRPGCAYELPVKIIDKIDVRPQTQVVIQ